MVEQVVPECRGVRKMLQAYTATTVSLRNLAASRSPQPRAGASCCRGMQTYHPGRKEFCVTCSGRRGVR